MGLETAQFDAAGRAAVYSLRPMPRGLPNASSVVPALFALLCGCSGGNAAPCPQTPLTPPLEATVFNRAPAFLKAGINVAVA